MEFERLVKPTGTEYTAKGFSSWRHFVAMLFCQLGQAHSLREICNGLANCFGKLRHLGISRGPKRSTLAYANEHRSWELFEKVFFGLLSRCQAGQKCTLYKPSFCPTYGEHLRLPVPANRHILKDKIIKFTGFYGHRDCPHLLRRVEVFDKENEEVIVVLTNHLTFGATTISAIYKDRWQIGIFFKVMKQNLRIKTFVVTSANALKIQIWTSLIAILLLKYLKVRSQYNWSLSNLVALLRLNLFTYRDLWEWIDRPCEPPPIIQEAEQVQLGLV